MKEAVADTAETPLLLLTATQAAQRCGCSERTWRTWHSAGHVPLPVRVGKSLFWRPKELAAWVDAGCPNRKAWLARCA